MPTIAVFFGFVVQMYWRDHPPPHIHVFYQDSEAIVAIETGELLAGHLPPGARRLIREWVQRRKAELMMNWERGRMKAPFHPVAGADIE